MKGKQLHCDRERLNSLLSAEEASDEFQLALLHIEQCPTCRQQLEQLAATEELWRQSHSALTPDEFDDSLLASTIDSSWQRLQRASPATNWTETMARQLLQPPSHPEMLGRLGRYEVERLIGSGGMGIVFKAFDTELNRPVAIKVLAPHLAGNGAARQRFAREARAAAAVVHEHIVAIYNVESNELSPFLVMQYVAGESLQQRIDRLGPLELREILRIAMQTAAGLAAAHAQGLVHRDIKPANILLEQGVERTLLTDFGLARASDDASLTHTGFHLGTPQYMSPEQASGEPIDARSDLFSLGSVIYAMCTGRAPFRAETTLGVLRRIGDHQPRAMREVNPEVPEWLQHLVARLHAKSPQQRLSTAEEARGLLEQCLAHVQQPTIVRLPEELRHSAQPSAGASARPLRKWLLRASAMVCGLSVIAGSILWQFINQPAPVPPSANAATQWEWGQRELETSRDEISKLESQALQWWPSAE